MRIFLDKANIQYDGGTFHYRVPLTWVSENRRGNATVNGTGATIEQARICAFERIQTRIQAATTRLEQPNKQER